MKVDSILLKIFQGISNEIFWAINVNNFQLARWCFVPGTISTGMNLIINGIFRAEEIGIVEILVFITFIGTSGLFNILSKKEEEKWIKNEKPSNKEKRQWNDTSLRMLILGYIISTAIIFRGNITGGYPNILFSTVLCALYFLACTPSTSRKRDKKVCCA